MTRRVLVTGMLGFIGSHFAEAILKTTDWHLVGLDRIDQTSTLHRLTETDAFRQNAHRLTFVWHDLKAPINEFVAAEIGEVDTILHLAASTHVDRSITDPVSFVMDNVLGTCHLLEFARRCASLRRMINFSTDEVFGHAPEGVAYKEWDRTRSGNPYSATKAGAVELCTAYHNTYGVPVFNSACMNAIGERQNQEKYVPLLVRKLLLGEKVTIHADPTCTKPARRAYIHARNIWNVVAFLLEHGEPGERYNICGDRELDCLEMAQMIASVLERPLKYEMTNFHSTRPGHDLRYSLDPTRLREMGFRQPISFEESLRRTVRWYEANPRWLGLDAHTAARAA